MSFVEGAKRGTVLMSLGTNVKADILDTQVIKNILETFAQLSDYNFIWKWNDKELPAAPSKNVLMSSFLPQNDILAHSKVKAFITHSGLLSMQESMWYGKPMVTIPFFIDQNRNAARSVRMGVAVKIDFRTLSVNEFKNAILAVLEDHSFTNKAKEFSMLFQDKPKKPIDTAIWWIEYAIRNPLVPQLPSRNLNFFVSNSYDVIFTAVIMIHVLIYILFKGVTRIRKTISKSESHKLKSN